MSITKNSAIPALLFLLVCPLALRAQDDSVATPRMAILDIKTDSPALRKKGALIVQMLESELVSSRLLTIAERRDLPKILLEQAYQESGCTDSICAVKLGQILAADLILVGTLGRYVSSSVLNINIYSVSDGMLVFSKTILIEEKTNLESEIHNLSLSIVARLTEPETTVRTYTYQQKKTAYMLNIGLPGFGHLYHERWRGFFYLAAFLGAAYNLAAVPENYRDKTTFIDNYRFPWTFLTVKQNDPANPILNQPLAFPTFVLAGISERHKIEINEKHRQINRALGFLLLAWTIPVMDLMFIEFAIDRQNRYPRYHIPQQQTQPPRQLRNPGFHVPSRASSFDLQISLRFIF